MWNKIKEIQFSCNPRPLSDNQISWYNSVAMVFCVSALGQSVTQWKYIACFLLRRV